MLKTLKKNTVFTFATSYFAFSFALGPFMMSVGLIIFVFVSLFHIQKFTIEKREILFLAGYCMLFLLYTIGIFKTPFIDRGINLVVRTLPIILVPIFLILTKASIKLNYKILKQFFIYGTLLSCIISLLSAGLQLAQGSSYSQILYFDFARIVHLHPTYYSLYIVTALVFLFGVRPPLILWRLKFCIGIIFVLALILLQSKIALLLIITLGVFYFLRTLFIRNKGETIFLGILLVVLLTGAFLMKGGRLNELTKERDKAEIGTLDEDGLSQRLWLWKTAKEHMQESQLLGFGLGSQEKLFRYKVAKTLLKTDLSPAVVKATKSISTLNMHNNYIQVWYELGLIGLCSFVIGIIVVIIEGVKRQNYQGILVYCVFLVMLGVEVMLNRQMGIYYYSFIPILLLLETSKNASNEM